MCVCVCVFTSVQVYATKSIVELSTALFWVFLIMYSDITG